MWQGMVAPPCPIKIYTDRFLSDHPFNVKCILIKRQLHPPLAVFATLYGKGSYVTTLLQSTVS